MFKDFVKKFKELPDSNKSMIFLNWIYNTGGIISGIFVSIYIFFIQNNILDVLFYNFFFVTFSLIGFTPIALLMSKLKKDIKNIYYFAYLAFGLSYSLIFLFDGYLGVYLFGAIYGLGNGLFHLAMHTQSLVNIEDENRDHYSSVISAGSNLIKIIFPFIISGIFFIVGKYFNFDPYLILFGFLPIIYWISFYFIGNIGEYIPKKVKKIDFENFFNIKKYGFAHLYFICVGFYQVISWTLYGVIAILLLKTEINVGIFEGLATLISVILLIFLSAKRAGKNRVKFMGILSILLFINLAIFSFNFNLIGYIIFTIFMLILKPLYQVSEHVFDLRIMDNIKVEGSDFYPAMLFREIIMWLGRFLMIVIIFCIIKFGGFSNEEVVKISLFFSGIFFILAWVSISLYVKYENKEL